MPAFRNSPPRPSSRFSAHKMRDKHNHRDEQQQVDETAGDMSKEPDQPEDDEKYAEECEHGGLSVLLTGREGSFLRLHGIVFQDNHDVVLVVVVCVSGFRAAHDRDRLIL